MDREQPFVGRSLLALLGPTCLQWVSDEHPPSNDNTAHCQASLRFDGIKQISSMGSKSPEGSKQSNIEAKMRITSQELRTLSNERTRSIAHRLYPNLLSNVVAFS